MGEPLSFRERTQRGGLKTHALRFFSGHSGTPLTPCACGLSRDQAALANGDRGGSFPARLKFEEKGFRDVVPVAKLANREGIGISWVADLLGHDWCSRWSTNDAQKS